MWSYKTLPFAILPVYIYLECVSNRRKIKRNNLLCLLDSGRKKKKYRLLGFLSQENAGFPAM